jgi:hypothetical protein
LPAPFLSRGLGYPDHISFFRPRRDSIKISHNQKRRKTQTWRRKSARSLLSSAGNPASVDELLLLPGFFLREGRNKGSGKGPKLFQALPVPATIEDRRGGRGTLPKHVQTPVTSVIKDALRSCTRVHDMLWLGCATLNTPGCGHAIAWKAHPQLGRQISRALRAVVNTLLPFLIQLADNDVESVLVSNELEQAGRTGGLPTVFRCCRDLHATNPNLLYLLLRHVPGAFALDMLVLFHRILSCYSRAVDLGFGSKLRNEARISKFRIVRLVSCGISEVNLSDWIPLLMLCQRLVLADSKLDRSTLTKLRGYLQQGSAGWFGFIEGWLRLFLSRKKQRPRVKRVKQQNQGAEGQKIPRSGRTTQYGISRSGGWSGVKKSKE